MIVPMRKYSFLVYHKEYDDFLLKLRELGVVHIIEREGSVTENILARFQRAEEVNKLIRFLDSRQVQPELNDEKVDAAEIVAELEEIQAEYARIDQQKTLLRKETAEIEPWGDFSPEQMHELEKKGFKIRLFITPLRDWNSDLSDHPSVFEINQSGGLVYFAVVDQGKGLPDDFNADEVKIPVHSLQWIEQEELKLEKHQIELNKRVSEMAKWYIPALHKYEQELLQDAELKKAFETTEKLADERLSILEGWIPAGAAEVL
ncbi:MAG TPA: hypothetical protein DCL86_06525, partial [Bacteroidales bacterium]|nr:hypothetical protein [Bacteroidales bacterium]